MRQGRKLAALLAGGAALVLLAAPAAALINPLFTPVDLVKQSKYIVLVKAGSEAKRKIPLRVVRTLKGKAPAKELVVDLDAAPAKEHGDELARLLAGTPEGTPILLFAGRFRDREEDEMPGEVGEAAPDEEIVDEKYQPALLHLPGKWFGLFPGEGGAEGPGPEVLDLFGMNVNMEGTWNGDADMLLRAVEYVLARPNADVPVRSNATWVERIKLGKLEGKACDLQAVDLAGKGEPALFLASGSGDRLYAYDAKAKKHTDVAGARALGSKSLCAAWGDFDGDKRLDLASWDGAAVTLWAQGADGAFKAKKMHLLTVPKKIVGLAALDMNGVTGLLVSAGGGTPSVLYAPEGDARGARFLMPGAVDTGKLGGAGPCLVADFDGDAIADVIQPFAKGGVFHKGTGKGAFAPAAPCAVACGEGSRNASLADFDQDGRLDIFVAAPDGFRLWNNRGAGKFVETFYLTGEPSYIAPRQSEQFICSTGDVNNDGREDFLVIYAPAKKEEFSEDDKLGPKRFPYLFFNRGFRSFGHAHKLDIDENESDEGFEVLAPEAWKGGQAGLLADLDGDAAQEMALVLADGGIWLLRRAALDPWANKVIDEPALGVSVALPPGATGPVTVTARSEQEERFLGARNVTAAHGAFIGLREPGAVTLTWRWPGGVAQKKKLLVLDSRVRFVLPAKK